jgi:glucose/arabinose dehydrogenase
MTLRSHIRNILILTVIALVAGYWYLTTPDKARVDISRLTGAAPELQAPRRESFPTIKIAEIVGWKAGARPVAASGLRVNEFAGGLDHPRWIHVLPNGDVLVAESSAPKRPIKDFQDWVARTLIFRAGGGDPSADRITLLRDTNGDGVADQRSVLLSGLHSPFGMALKDETLFVANTDAVLAFPFKVGDTKITAKGDKLIDLPSGLPNNHWTRNLMLDPSGESLYVTIGSNSNIGENGMESEKGRAEIRQYEFKTKKQYSFAYGLRNPTGMAFNPISKVLWTVVNERDMLGSDGPPDYLTSVDFGTFYGWPFTYWGVEDQRVPQVRPDLKQYTKRPNYAMGPHVAALGLTFAQAPTLGANFANGAFVGLHGSWNRYPPSGYKVVFVPFNDRGYPLEKAKPIDVLTGFLTKDGDAQGRPVGVSFDKTGALLVADDAGDKIWRVSAAQAVAAR